MVSYFNKLDDICTQVDGIESSVEYLDIVLNIVEDKLQELESKKWLIYLFILFILIYIYKKNFSLENYRILKAL